MATEEDPSKFMLNALKRLNAIFYKAATQVLRIQELADTTPGTAEVEPPFSGNEIATHLKF